MKIRLSTIILPFVLAATILSGGCAYSGLFGHSSHQVEKQSNRISEIQDKIDDNTSEKIFQAKDFSFGTGYALGQATNSEPAIQVAKDLNSRVQNILGLPPLEQQKEMTALVNGLIADNINAKIKLRDMDRNIIALQQEEEFLIKAKDKEIQKALDLSAQIALQADASKQELGKYRGWFGLSAVFMGLKQFFTTSLWFLLGFGLIFIVLRVLSTVNPIAGAIFSIVDVMFSWVVNAVKFIAPKAMTVAKTVSTEAYHASQSALTAIVDSVETVRLQGIASGKEPTIEDLLNTAELSMTPEDKAVIEKIKLKLNWVKPSTESTVAPKN